MSSCLHIILFLLEYNSPFFNPKLGQGFEVKFWHFVGFLDDLIVSSLSFLCVWAKAWSRIQFFLSRIWIHDRRYSLHPTSMLMEMTWRWIEARVAHGVRLVKQERPSSEGESIQAGPDCLPILLFLADVMWGRVNWSQVFKLAPFTVYTSHRYAIIVVEHAMFE